MAGIEYAQSAIEYVALFASKKRVCIASASSEISAIFAGEMMRCVGLVRKHADVIFAIYTLKAIN
jgi:hypothetical protein